MEGVEGVAAYAAFLSLAGLKSEKASAYAAEEGIVSHLTSLVLVDDVGEAVEGIPAQRKVPLAASLAASSSPVFAQSFSSAIRSAPMHLVGSSASDRSGNAMRSMHVAAAMGPAVLEFHDKSATGAAPAGKHSHWGGGFVPMTRADDLTDQTWLDEDFSGNDPADLTKILRLGDLIAGAPIGRVSPPEDWKLKTSMATAPIAWDEHIEAFLNVKVQELPLNIRARIVALTVDPGVKGLAQSVGKDVEALAIGLIAYLDRKVSRTADRIQRRHLKGILESSIEAVLANL